MQRADALSFLAWKAVVMTSTRTYLLKAFLLLALFSPAPVLSEQDRPNILFAFADDWGCYASAYAQVDSRRVEEIESAETGDQGAQQREHRELVNRLLGQQRGVHEDDKQQRNHSR